MTPTSRISEEEEQEGIAVRASVSRTDSDTLWELRISNYDNDDDASGSQRYQIYDQI